MSSRPFSDSWYADLGGLANPRLLTCVSPRPGAAIQGLRKRLHGCDCPKELCAFALKRKANPLISTQTKKVKCWVISGQPLEVLTTKHKPPISKCTKRPGKKRVCQQAALLVLNLKNRGAVHHFSLEPGNRSVPTSLCPNKKLDGTHRIRFQPLSLCLHRVPTVTENPAPLP